MLFPRLNPEDLGRPKSLVRNPIQAGLLYVYRQTVYDCYMVAVATVLPVVTAFQAPRGQNYTQGIAAAVAKTWYHTNMTVAGQLPNPEKFYCRSVGLAFRSDISILDAHRLNFDMLLRLNIGRATYLHSHAFQVPAAGGLSGASAGIINNGAPVASNQFLTYGDLGETIEQLQNFNVELDPSQVSDSAAAGIYTTAAAAAGGTGINAFIILDGQFSREVA